MVNCAATPDGKPLVVTELIVPSTPLPLVCITLSRNERNCSMAFFTSRLAAFSMAFSGALRGVFDELGDFHGVPEKYRRDLRDVVDGAGAAAQVAAVHIGEAGFASGTDLQRKPHVARADFFHVAALLDHGEQDVVPLVEQRKFVAHFFQLQRDGLCVLHLCHWLVPLLESGESRGAGVLYGRWRREVDVIPSGFARGVAFPAVFAGARRSRGISLRLTRCRTVTSKRDSSTASRAAHTPRAEKKRGTSLGMTAHGKGAPV